MAIARLRIELPCAEVHQRAAAGRNDGRTVLEETGDHARLAVAKIGLAVFREDFRNRHAGGLFDLGVGVDERQPDARREATPDRAFAGTRHADECNRPRAEASAQCLSGALLQLVLRGLAHGLQGEFGVAVEPT